MVTNFAAEGLEPFHDGDGQGAILFDPRRLRQAGPELFDPAHWGDAAQPVGNGGGRGAAWFLRGLPLIGLPGDALLRHYRRGGFAARLSVDRYVWTGANKTRSFREFRLLAELHGLRLPVPAPIAAAYRRRGRTYRADILLQRIPGTRSLAERMHEDDERLWTAIGRTLARFHRAGVDHADLNAHNVLLDAGDAVWLIDFDRGARHTPETAWRMRNLLRLRRSLLKLRGERPVERVQADFERLRAAYDRAWGEAL